MKKILLLMGVTIFTLTVVKADPNTTDEVNVDCRNHNFTYRTPESDTLFILDCPMGNLTKSIWDMDTNSTNKPTIILVENLPNR